MKRIRPVIILSVVLGSLLLTIFCSHLLQHAAVVSPAAIPDQYSKDVAKQPTSVLGEPQTVPMGPNPRVFELLRSPESRSKINATILYWAKRDPLQLSNAAKDMDSGEVRNLALTSAVSGLIDCKLPQDAMNVAQLLPQGESRTGAYKDIARYLAKNEPTNLGEFLRGLPLLQDRESAAVGVLLFDTTGITTNTLLAIADEVGTPRVTKAAIGAVTHRIFTVQESSVFDEWISKLPLELKDYALGAKVGAMQGSSESIETISKISDGNIQFQAYTTFLKMKMKLSFRESTDAFNQIPNEDLRKRLVAPMVSLLYGQDSGFLSSWIAGMKNGPVRDAGVAATVKTMLATNPAAAYELAVTVQDATIRRDLLKLLPPPK